MQDSKELQTAGSNAAAVMESVLLMGDLSSLTVPQRIMYYKGVCESVGLNPLTKPFDYLELDNGKGGKKLVLYAKKDCTDQLRNIHGVSCEVVDRQVIDGIFIVTVRATKPDGRFDTSIGAVPLVKENGTWTTEKRTSQKGTYDARVFKADGTYSPLAPVDKANAMMKAFTKAGRRVTLSICGLGLLDESEATDIAGAHATNFDPTEPEIKPQIEAADGLMNNDVYMDTIVGLRRDIAELSGDDEMYKKITNTLCLAVNTKGDLRAHSLDERRGLTNALMGALAALQKQRSISEDLFEQPAAEGEVVAHGK